MEQAGFEQVYQLDGGILKYFEECGGAHYEGACFVFDDRVALDPALQPTGNLLCYACQAVLTPEEITSEQFQFGQYCPHCFVPPVAQQQQKFAERQTKILQLAAAQPGCTPYDNVRHIHVAGRFAGWTLLDFLVAYQPAIERTQWQAWIDAGRIARRQVPRSGSGVNSGSGAKLGSVQSGAQRVVHADLVVREGECFEQHMPDTVEPAINPNIELLYEDASLVVVNKPAPLPTHPSGRFNRNSLLQLIDPAYPNEKLRVAHRLDANTSGVVVLCRKHQSARFVQPQFSEQGVAKRYVARVTGHPEWQTTTCAEPITRDVDRQGGRNVAPATVDAPVEALATEDRSVPAVDAAETHFRLIARLEDNTSLIEARPLSGRTHQIRIHLWHLGHAVVGDPLYLPNLQRGTVATLPVGAPTMCLHAHQLTLVHPESRQPVTYTAPLPDWGKRAESDAP
jgi:RluA family pseudouridine synthase